MFGPVLRALGAGARTFLFTFCPSSRSNFRFGPEPAGSFCGEGETAAAGGSLDHYQSDPSKWKKLYLNRPNEEFCLK